MEKIAVKRKHFYRTTPYRKKLHIVDLWTQT